MKNGENSSLICTHSSDSVQKFMLNSMIQRNSPTFSYFWNSVCMKTIFVIQKYGKFSSILVEHKLLISVIICDSESNHLFIAFFVHHRTHHYDVQDFFWFHL